MEKRIIGQTKSLLDGTSQGTLLNKMMVKALDTRIMVAASKATTPEDIRALGLEEDENIADFLAVLR